MLLGFALTEHCNLRCAHCIRDDVTTVRSLDVGLVERIVEGVRARFGAVTVSLTGGEPTIHPRFDELVRGFAARGVAYRFVSNGWHMRRLMPLLTECPPEYVRLSLSGATEEIHDEERGRGSFRRVLMACALLASRRIPTALSIVIDRRDRHQVREAADLAEALGVLRLHVILPQPVPGSVARDSDLAPHEWAPVVREVREIGCEAGRRTVVALDYGAPALEGDEALCDTMAMRRMYVDARGQLSACCQLSEYGFTNTDVVADLATVPLDEAFDRYATRIAELRRAAAPPPPAQRGPMDAFPCMRCARATGKTAWLARFPASPWHALAAAPAERDSAA